MENTNEIMTMDEEIEVIETTEVEELDAYDKSSCSFGVGVAVGAAVSLVVGYTYKKVVKPFAAKIKAKRELKKAEVESNKKIEVIDYDENGNVTNVNVEESK